MLIEGFRCWIRRAIPATFGRVATWVGCIFLGLAYEKGEGVKKSAARAHEYYLQSCNRGPVWACYKLGMMNLHGKGTSQHTGQAEFWFGEGCKKGHKDSCAMLESLK